MSEPLPLETRLQQVQRRALIVAAVAAVLWLVGAVISPARFFQSYLVGFMFWLGASLGSLAILMLHELTGGRWMRGGMRAWFQAGALTVMLMTVLFFPLLVGLPQVYTWARSGAAEADPILFYKSGYLNIASFIARAGLYFLVWISLAVFLTRWTGWPGRDQPQRAERLNQRLAGPGLIAYVLTITFASFDWTMSLDSHWYSTIWGLQFVISQALTALALGVLFFTWSRGSHVTRLAAHAPPTTPREQEVLHDLGNLTLMLVSFWAYLAFMQYLIIYAGNLPEHVVWYVPRVQGAWGWIALLLIVFHFALPFVILLNRGPKQSRLWMQRIALGLIIVHGVNMIWVIVPSLPRTGWIFDWRDVVSIAAIGGLWVAACIWVLGQRPGPAAQQAQLDPAGEGDIGGSVGRDVEGEVGGMSGGGHEH